MRYLFGNFRQVTNLFEAGDERTGLLTEFKTVPVSIIFNALLMRVCFDGMEYRRN